MIRALAFARLLRPAHADPRYTAAVPTEPPSPEPEPPPTLSEHLEDVCSIDAIVNAVYESVSFSGQQGPDSARLRSLVAAEVRLQKVVQGGNTLVGDIDAYLKGKHGNDPRPANTGPNEGVRNKPNFWEPLGR